MSTLDRKIQEFCYRYQATVGRSDRQIRRAHMVRPGYSHFDDLVAYATTYEDEPATRIDLPDELFRTLVQMDSVLQHWDEQEYRETRLREANPALKKAYEHYTLMLKLIDSDGGA